MTATLFTGDLSSLCDIDDVERLFSTCGTIVDIRLKFDELTKKQLSYGFVVFLSSAEAETALHTLNGYVLRGRALRISWANTKPPLTKERSISSISSAETQSKSVGATKSSIHVVFYTASTTGMMVTEETLRAVFSLFGNFVDAIVKKTNKEHVINSKGYAFVHFADTDAGVASAMAAVRAVGRGLVLDGVYYECSLSRSFQDTMAETAAQQNSSHVYGSPGSSPTGVDGVLFLPPPVDGSHADEAPRNFPIRNECAHQQNCQPVYPVVWRPQYVHTTMPVTHMSHASVHGPAPVAYAHHQSQHQHPVYVEHRPVCPPHQQHVMSMQQQMPVYPMAAPAPVSFPPQPYVGDAMMGGGHVYPAAGYPPPYFLYDDGGSQVHYGNRYYRQ